MPWLAALGALAGVTGSIAGPIVGGLIVATTLAPIATSIVSAVQKPPEPPRAIPQPDRLQSQQAGIDQARRARRRSGRESTTLLQGALQLIESEPQQDVLGG